MADEKLLSIQEIDAHIEQYSKVVATQKLEGEALKAFNICATYTVVRPVLVFAKSILGFFKPSWAAVLGTFIAAVDAACTPIPPVE